MLSKSKGPERLPLNLGAGFANFYFVGDDDLLEIIGNSKDVVKSDSEEEEGGG